MIYNVSLCLVCEIFVDFGDNHIIIDEKGKEAKSYFAKKISQKIKRA